MLSGSVTEARRDGGSPVCRLLRFGGGFARHGTVSVWILLLLLPLAGAQPGAGTGTGASEDPYQTQRFSASMAIIIVILVAALFFMGFFSIYIRHCSETRASGSIRRAAGALGLSRRAPRGLDQAVLETFPTFEYSSVKEFKFGKDVLECAVCLNEFEDDETLRLIPKCDHVFHSECIDAWLSAHVTCPVCRANLAEPMETTDEPASPEATGSAADPDHDGDGEDRSEINAVRQVSIRVADEENDAQRAPVDIKPIQSLQQNRPPRSKSIRPRKFPRSHSTGHSIVLPCENCERFTLKLPDDVRKQIMNRALNRSRSLAVMTGEESTRQGYRNAGEGSSRGKYFRRFDRLDRSGKSDRWTFSIAPPFFSRAASLKSPRVAADDEATSSTTPRKPPLTPKGTSGSKRDNNGTPPATSPRPTAGSPRPPV